MGLRNNQPLVLRNTLLRRSLEVRQRAGKVAKVKSLTDTGWAKMKRRASYIPTEGRGVYGKGPPKEVNQYMKHRFAQKKTFSDATKPKLPILKTGPRGSIATRPEVRAGLSAQKKRVRLL
jgi:hypothetical protein